MPNSWYEVNRMYRIFAHATTEHQSSSLEPQTIRHKLVGSYMKHVLEILFDFAFSVCDYWVFWFSVTFHTSEYLQEWCILALKPAFGFLVYQRKPFCRFRLRPLVRYVFHNCYCTYFSSCFPERQFRVNFFLEPDCWVHFLEILVKVSIDLNKMRRRCWDANGRKWNCRRGVSIGCYVRSPSIILLC